MQTVGNLAVPGLISDQLRDVDLNFAVDAHGPGQLGNLDFELLTVAALGTNDVSMRVGGIAAKAMVLITSAVNVGTSRPPTLSSQNHSLP